MIKILSHLEVPICYDQSNGCVRPYWEGGAPRTRETREDANIFPTALNTSKIAIHCHVFYVELLPELMDAWQVIAERQLLISTDTAAKANIIKKVLERNGETSAVIRVCKNRGRDLGPLLTAFADVLNDFEVLIHCHTKKTPQEDQVFGTQWRQLLTAATFPKDPALLNTIYNLLASPSGGLVMAWPHRIYAHNVNWGKNFRQTRAILKHLGHDVKRFDLLYFPAGSFFWIRLDQVKLLSHLQLRPEDFCAEPTPGDGRLAHALERSLGLLPMLQDRDNYAVWLGHSNHGLPGGAANTVIGHLPSQRHTQHIKQNWFKQGMNASLAEKQLGQQSIPLGCLGDYG